MAQRVATRRLAEAEFLRLLREDRSANVRLQAAQALVEAGPNTPDNIVRALVEAIQRERDTNVKVAFVALLDHATASARRPPSTDVPGLLRNATLRRNLVDRPLSDIAGWVGRVTLRQLGKAIGLMAAVIAVLDFLVAATHALLHLLLPSIVH